MEVGNYQVFGIDMSNYNPHWLRTYGQVLIFIAGLDMKDTVHLIDCSSREDYEDIDEVDKLLQEHDVILEGYTLREVSKWFIQYCKDWHKRNIKVQKQAKLDAINKLKLELKQLEDEL